MTTSTTPPVREGLARDEEGKDLGFGTVVSQQSGIRLVNRDGSFNVVRHGLSFLTSLSAYHWLVTMSWTRFLGSLAVSMGAWNTLFAGAYLLCGPGALQVPESARLGHPWLSAFFFSVQTFATIGYGQIAPAGIAANMVVVVESFLSIVFLTLVTGIVFARFARPTARVMFSERAVIAPHRGGRALMLRLVNVRQSQLFELSAKIVCAYWTGVGGRRKRQFANLELERPSVNFLPLSWTLVHPMVGGGPLSSMDEATFRRADPEFLVLLSGVDETWEQTVHARTSYAASDIVWGARFADIFDRRRDDELAIDVRRLSEVEPAALGADPGVA